MDKEAVGMEREGLLALAGRIEEANGMPIAVDVAAANAIRALAQQPAAQAVGLTDDMILHRWDTHVGDVTESRPLTSYDKIAFARAIEREVLSRAAPSGEPVEDNEAYDRAYDKIDRFLRSNLGDDDYAEFSQALDSLAAPAAAAEQAIAQLERERRIAPAALNTPLDAALRAAPAEEARAGKEAEQRARMEVHFASRRRTPATEDFDLIAPNDEIHAEEARGVLAYIVDIPDEPELGHWFAEERCDLPGYRCRPLALAAPAAEAAEEQYRAVIDMAYQVCGAHGASEAVLDCLSDAAGGKFTVDPVSLLPYCAPEPVYDKSVVKRIATQMGWTPPSAQPAEEARGVDDAIAKSKRILALVDDYVEQQTSERRTALRVALMNEFEALLAAPAAAEASYAERVRQWREFGDGMHRRAMKAERELAEAKAAQSRPPEGAALTRYDFTGQRDRSFGECADGKYVLFSDVAAILARASEPRAEGLDIEAIAKAAWDEAWELAFSDGESAGHPLGRSYLNRDSEWDSSEVRAALAAQKGEA